MNAITRIMTLIGLWVILLCPWALAADGELLYNTQYCFQPGDFSCEGTVLPDGILITGVPDDRIAALKLGNRTIRSGDILSEETLHTLRLLPQCAENCEAVVCYQPILGSTLAAPAQLTIRIRSGENEAPSAADQKLETYKNVANDGQLSGTDPEDGPLIYALETQPKRGSVSLQEDGRFLYTPEKNKVGEDHFTYTVTDDAGNVSPPATVHIRIRKPTESMGYADMAQHTDCFEAMWLQESGILGGSSVAEQVCFCPENTVSRSEFLLMTLKMGKIPVQEHSGICCFSDVQEDWLQPYLTTALHHGIIQGEQGEAGLCFRPKDPITGEEAALMLQNLLSLPVSAAAPQREEGDWAATALQALNEAGICFSSAEQPLRRDACAAVLYQAAQLP